MRINKLLLLPLWAASIAHAGELTISVVDNEGNALNNIAVLAKSDAHPVPLGEALPLDAVMDQINRQFVPHTLVVLLKVNTLKSFLCSQLLTTLTTL